jgi:ankyrin repeat protein
MPQMNQIDPIKPLEAAPFAGDAALSRRHAPAERHSRRRRRSRPSRGGSVPSTRAFMPRPGEVMLPRIEKLAATGANLNARDSHGRTPLHVATFARQRGAIRALVKAGADINLLENDRYDGVTIASVADDEETLRVLLSLGASAKQVTSRYDGTALIAAAHLGTTAWCAS